MGLMSLVGDDTLVINDRPVHLEFAEGDTAVIDFPNDLVTISTGKNKNTIYAKNESGSNFDLTFSVMRGGKVDRFLNGLQVQQDEDFAGFILMTGAFTKRLGDGQGNITYDTYLLQGMVFVKPVPAKGNISGDTEQGKATYTLRGALATRALT